MKVDMNLLKQLRDMTFAPLNDCKSALEEANLDLEQAQEILRKKGLAKAGKKADRETKEGIVKLVQKNGRSYGIKLLCETDFVAKNENFQALFDHVLDKVFALQKNITSINDLDPAVVEDLNTTVMEGIAKIGENLKLGDVVMTDKNVCIYNHPGNRVACLVGYEGGDESVAKEVALQITAMNPTCINVDEVDPAVTQKMKMEFVEELKASGKSENVIEQIVVGKLQKAYGEFVLMEQEYIRDGGKRIKDILPAGCRIISFIRLAIGE